MKHFLWSSGWFLNALMMKDSSSSDLTFDVKLVNVEIDGNQNVRRRCSKAKYSNALTDASTEYFFDHQMSFPLHGVDFEWLHFCIRVPWLLKIDKFLPTASNAWFWWLLRTMLGMEQRTPWWNDWKERSSFICTIKKSWDSGNFGKFDWLQ